MVRSPTLSSLYGSNAPALSVMSACGYSFKDYRHTDDSQAGDPIGGVPLVRFD